MSPAPIGAWQRLSPLPVETPYLAAHRREDVAVGQDADDAVGTGQTEMVLDRIVEGAERIQNALVQSVVGGDGDILALERPASQASPDNDHADEYARRHQKHLAPARHRLKTIRSHPRTPGQAQKEPDQGDIQQDKSDADPRRRIFLPDGGQDGPEIVIDDTQDDGVELVIKLAEKPDVDGAQQRGGTTKSCRNTAQDARKLSEPSRPPTRLPATAGREKSRATWPSKRKPFPSALTI